MRRLGHPTQSFPSSGSSVQIRSTALNSPPGRKASGGVSDCFACRLLRQPCSSHRPLPRRPGKSSPGCFACELVRGPCLAHARKVA